MQRNSVRPLQQNVIPTGGVMGLRPTQANETGFHQFFCPFLTELSSRPERTRIFYFALLATATYAALRKESRTVFINATTPHRKSGGAQWRDLLFSRPLLRMFFDRAARISYYALPNTTT